jgi:NTP pyrophosphatase (non-canonical NTP hydrolase)
VPSEAEQYRFGHFPKGGVLMTDSNAGLKLSDYQAQALKADMSPEPSLAFPLLGLFGEAGSLLSVVKKKQRDRAAYLGYAPHVVEELGDVLWYFTVVAARGGLALSEIANNINRDFSDRNAHGGMNLRFRSLQSKRAAVKNKPTRKFEHTLLDLAGEVGTILSEYQAGRLHGNQDVLRGRLVAVMRTLVKAADEAGVTLETAAEENLTKIFDRWPPKRIYPPPLDMKALKAEQLPRKLTIDIFERKVRGEVYVFQQCNGISVGDRLTDNATEPDDYRFHDVFHYAYCAVLTWSPVVRALLRLKRKSEPLIDEAQDGARAILIEEGIASWIFGQAKRLDFFAGMKPADLSFDILKTVRQFVAGYEPDRCPLWLWEEAILQGFEAFRFLQKKRRARLRIDMARRRLYVGELPRDA